jgi:hypothetical protein
MMGSKRIRKVMAGLTLALALAGCIQPVAPTATEEATRETTGQPLTITIGEAGLTAPAELPAGIVTLTVENELAGPASADLFRLNEGATLAAVEQALQEGNFGALMESTTGLAGLFWLPGQAGEVTYQLTEGDYFWMMSGGDGPPALTPATVTDDDTGATAPEAEIEVELADFAFILPDEIPAGEHVWQFTNTGQQWHHMGVVQLNEGVTLEQFLQQMTEMATAGEEPQGPPPFTEVAWWQDMSPGVTSWATIDLPAGEYYAVCFLPDITDEAMTPHLLHGMVRKLVVK